MKLPPFRYPLLWPITTNTHTNTDRYRWQAAEGYQAIPGGSGRRARARARRVPARNRAAEGSVARQREGAQLLCQCLRGGESRPRFLSMISGILILILVLVWLSFCVFAWVHKVFFSISSYLSICILSIIWLYYFSIALVLVISLVIGIYIFKYTQHVAFLLINWHNSAHLPNINTKFWKPLKSFPRRVYQIAWGTCSA